MYEQNTVPPNGSVVQNQDAIEISDFVYAATGARVRRLTTPDGTHWFPAVDVCRHLGYAHVGSALRNIADAINFASAESVLQKHGLGTPAGREWRRDMNLVNLQGLIRLVNGCTKAESQPFKSWVSDVIATIQRDGSYTLEAAPVQPAPSGGTAYLMPQEVADAIVRLEERNIRADEALIVAQEERIQQMRRTNEQLGNTNDLLGRTDALLGESHRAQSSMADALHRIADTLDLLADRFKPATPAERAPAMTPQELLAGWRAKNLVVTEDVHAVAAYLAPALVRGPARCRLEEVASRTGLTLDRVHDCVRMLLKRGCVRQAGCGPDDTPVYVLP